MQRDTDVPPEREPGATLRLRVETFDLMTRIVGKDTDTARAHLIGVHRKTVSRAREGVVGEEFVAKTVAALRKHQRLLSTCGMEATLDSLFEVVEPQEVAA